MDYERLLVNQVARSGQINMLMAEGIRDDHFIDESLKPIWAFMTDHYRRYKIAPAFETVQAEFPEHNFEISGESVQYLKDRFKRQVLRARATEALFNIAEALDDPENSDDIDSLFMEQSRKLAQIMPTAKLHSFKDMEKRIEAYEAGDGLERGIKVGVPFIDNLTLGIQPHEYITIFGPSGVGKSTLGQWALFNAWMQAKTPMYISMEMEAKALFRKWDTMLMNFEYHDLKAHSLREEEIERWKNRAKEIADKPNDIIVMDDVRGCTVDRVYAELVRWNPDILCVDYISLMSTRHHHGQIWEKITYLTQELKQVSRTLNIPIIGIAQANRSSFSEGATLENIAGSISGIQDADLVFGLHSDEEMRKNKQMELRMLKNRDGMTGSTNLWWDMNTMEFGPWDETRFWKNRTEMPAIPQER